jgi:hypothetical protein
MKWAAKETFRAVLAAIIIPAILRAVSPAEAATTQRPTCETKPELPACTKAAQGASAVLAERALRDVLKAPNGSLEGIRIRCNDGERQEACDRRFREDLLRAIQSRSGEIAALTIRAQGFADAWPTCQAQVHHDKSADDQHKIKNAVDACMTSQGYGSEIAAIRLVYSASGG